MSAPNPQKGLFITLEGSDGVGKTTQAKLLAGRIACKVEEETLVYQLREPGGTPVCEDIRNILKTGQDIAPICELMLFNAARNELVEKMIKPATDAGHIVVCDRFMDSTVAYQHFGNGIPMSFVQSAITMAVAGKLPDITIMLMLEEEEANRRANQKEGKRDGISKYDSATVEYKRRVTQGFECQAKYFPKRIKVVDAQGTPEEVCEKIWDIVKPLLENAGLLLGN